MWGHRYPRRAVKEKAGLEAEGPPPLQRLMRKARTRRPMAAAEEVESIKIGTWLCMGVGSGI